MWEQLDEHLRAMRPGYYARLLPGLSDAEIAAAWRALNGLLDDREIPASSWDERWLEEQPGRLLEFLHDDPGRRIVAAFIDKWIAKSLKAAVAREQGLWRLYPCGPA